MSTNDEAERLKQIRAVRIYFGSHDGTKMCDIQEMKQLSPGDITELYNGIVNSGVSKGW